MLENVIGEWFKLMFHTSSICKKNNAGIFLTIIPSRSVFALVA